MDLLIIRPSVLNFRRRKFRLQRVMAVRIRRVFVAWFG